VGIRVGAEMIDKIIEMVNRKLEGRFANGGNSAQVTLDIIEKAGDGNYLEIGVLHGGSLCAVGLYKQALGHKGVCIGVDPFNGFYFSKTGKIADKSGVMVIEQTVLDNIKRFELTNIELIKAYSPDFTTDKTFNVAYIDGDHTKEGAFQDWNKVKDITTDFVIFHDYGAIPGVDKAVDAALSDPEWKLYSVDKMIAVLQRASV
jgi:hypothetical protein